MAACWGAEAVGPSPRSILNRVPLSVVLFFEGLAVCTAQDVPQRYSRFRLEANTLALVDAPHLRLGVAGRVAVAGDGEVVGQPLALSHCVPGANEAIRFSGGMFHLEHAPEMCLQPADTADTCSVGAGGTGGGGGCPLEEGATIVMRSCATNIDGMTDAKLFFLASDGRIVLKRRPGLCVRVDGRIEQGASLTLRRCENSLYKNNPGEMFEIVRGFVRLKAHPNLHWNVVGGDLSSPSSVVLWWCQPRHHDQFEFTKDRRLRLTEHKHLCVEVDGGIATGRRLVVRPCAQGLPAPRELFAYDEMQQEVFSVHFPNLAFSVQATQEALPAGAASGLEAVLWGSPATLEQRDSA
eukprot:TRINITY_DN76662_c0_g1_i1.p1 TRINITY_DN76662_c0_g1~~TRINITY_DN76662_c0_g1_i1.p1  ORF type:complete len:369 (+),score=54.82 TRINITY_DN76662_c0_g1_i1:54-1109(+)